MGTAIHNPVRCARRIVEGDCVSLARPILSYEGCQFSKPGPSPRIIPEADIVSISRINLKPLYGSLSLCKDLFKDPEAKMIALCWTLESLAAHRLDNVIIAGEDATLLKVIERPRAWPSFTSEFHTLNMILNRFSGWKSKVESRSSNRCAFSIAKSAQQVQWGQSYVAIGAPRWLADVLLDDKG
ncbi:hypothetical protein Bca101_030023 [Brassica carinata]